MEIDLNIYVLIFTSIASLVSFIIWLRLSITFTKIEYILMTVCFGLLSLISIVSLIIKLL